MKPDDARPKQTINTPPNKKDRGPLIYVRSMRGSLLVAAAASLLPCVHAHAVMTKPTPRPGMAPGSGVKLQPYADAKKIADAGCGDPQLNKDPGVQVPTVAYRPGAQVQVEWKLTIPHPDDNEREGVRIALHYSAADSFKDNILAGRAVGDTVNANAKVAAGGPNDQADALVTETITLPAGKTCDYCTLQWMWSAQADGGSYIGCADIAITADGQLPDYTALPPQKGNILNGVPGKVYAAPGAPGAGTGAGSTYPPPAPYGGAVGGSQSQTTQQSCGLGGGPGAAIGFVMAVAGAMGGIYFYKQKKAKEAGTTGIGAVNVNMESSKPKTPREPSVAASNLPPGWAPETDPASGRTYYVHAATGQSSWTVPTA